MNRLGDAARAFARLWMRVWFEPVDPRPLAAFRIALGIYLLGYFLKYASIVELSFSNTGVYSPWVIPDVAPQSEMAWAIYGLALLAIGALTFGFFTRIATVLVLGLFAYHFLLNFAILNANYDRLIAIALLVLCCCDAGAIWSFDARRAREPRRIPAWQIRLLQFQLASFYFGTGLFKLFNVNWRSGTIVKAVMGSPWATPFAAELLDAGFPSGMFRLLTWSVVAFELVAGFTLYFRKTKVATMVIGTLFHLCNTVILYIPGFLICVAMYPLFFDFGPYPPPRPPAEPK